MIKLFQKKMDVSGKNNANPTTVADSSKNLLPQIDLKDKIIPSKLLNIIPIEVAKKYSVVFFEEDETSLKLAVGYPEKLKSNFTLSLDKIGDKLSKKIILYKANPQDIKSHLLPKNNLKSVNVLNSRQAPPTAAHQPTTTSSDNHKNDTLHPENKQIEKLVSQTPAVQTVQEAADFPKPEPANKTANIDEIVPITPVNSSAIATLAEPKSFPALTSEQNPKATPLYNNPLKPAVETPIIHKPPTSPPIKHTDIVYDKLPKLYIHGEIPLEVFAHIPYFFSQNHRTLCVDFVEPNQYTLAIENPDNPESQAIIKYLRENNKINLTIYQASDREITYLLREFQNAEDKKNQQKLEQIKSQQKNLFIHKPKKEKPKKDFVDQSFSKPQINEPIIKINETKLAEDVVTPELKGKIVTGERAKGGISGAMEKIGALFSTPKILPEDDNLELPDNPKKPNTTPPEHIQENKKIPVIKKDSTPTVVLDKAPDTPENAEGDESQNLGKLLKHDITSIEELKTIVKENNIPKIVAAIVSYAISLNASDVHIEPFEDELLIRYRIDGQLRNIIKLPPDMHAPLISRIKILSRLKLDETRIPQDGRFDVVFSSREVDLRVSSMPAVHGEKGVLRILDKSKGVISLESLGLEGQGFDILIDAINKPYGIIMATGPTGSGKSTTLYAILARVASPTVNVITLEDPVEYEMKGINQSQINPKIGYTFADGLRSILRQDPNIIMVGEVRDGETANMATQAALTGHLVLTTLHTNDASGALPRLINMGIEPFLITSSINAIIGQRLVRKICQKCKEPITLPEGVVKEVEEELSKISETNAKDQTRIIKPFKFFQGKGCSECNNTGYSGRVGVYEILPMSDKIEELTIARATANQMLDQGIKEGMITMKQDGLLKVLEGLTTLDEVLKETSNK